MDNLIIPLLFLTSSFSKTNHKPKKEASIDDKQKTKYKLSMKGEREREVNTKQGTG